MEDKEFLELALSLIGVGEKVSSNGQISHTQVVWCFYVFPGWYFQLTMFSLVKKRQLRPFVTTGESPHRSWYHWRSLGHCFVTTSDWLPVIIRKNDHRDAIIYWLLESRKYLLAVSTSSLGLIISANSFYQIIVWLGKFKVPSLCKCVSGKLCHRLWLVFCFKMAHLWTYYLEMNEMKNDDKHDCILWKIREKKNHL